MSVRIGPSRWWYVGASVVFIACLAAQPPRSEPPAKLIVDSPLAEPLSRGVVFIRYRAENLQIVPVLGSAALAVSPRIGHIHVTVDEASWRWADASGNPVILQGLASGRHKILIQLVNANHTVVDQQTVEVTVPARNSQPKTYLDRQ